MRCVTVCIRHGTFVGLGPVLIVRLVGKAAAYSDTRTIVSVQVHCAIYVVAALG